MSRFGLGPVPLVVRRCPNDFLGDFSIDDSNVNDDSLVQEFGNQQSFAKVTRRPRAQPSLFSLFLLRGDPGAVLEA